MFKVEDLETVVHVTMQRAPANAISTDTDSDKDNT